MQKSILLASSPARAVLRPTVQYLTATRSRKTTRCSRRVLSTSSKANQSKSPPSDQHTSNPSHGEAPPKPPSLEHILAETSPENNSLLAPVHIPEDANALLKSDHPATDILSQSGLVVQRQIEMMNLFLGFEQANRYVILDPHGNHIGYMAEHDGGLGKTMTRQWFNTHRAFTTHVFDRHSKEVLRFHRPFSWINTRIRVYDPLEPSSALETSSEMSLTRSSSEDPAGVQQLSHLPLDAMRVIGEAQSEWAPLRRKYSLFLSHDPVLSDPGSVESSGRSSTNASNNAPSFTQFASIDERFLSWDFSLLDENSRLIGSVNRSFRGFGREFFTDTGSYALRMDSAGLDEEAKQRHIVSQTAQKERAYGETLGASDRPSGMTLDQRAVMLATAVTVDFDYFSRHSGGSSSLLPLWMVGAGGDAAGGAAGGAVGAAGAGEAGGAVIGGAGRAVGSAAGGLGAGEGAIAGAGTMAGYEAMQRGMGRDSQASQAEASPQEQPYEQPYDSQSPQSGFEGQDQGGDVWGQGDSDPWSSQGSSGGSDGGGDGDGFFQTLWNLFFGD